MEINDKVIARGHRCKVLEIDEDEGMVFVQTLDEPEGCDTLFWVVKGHCEDDTGIWNE